MEIVPDGVPLWVTNLVLNVPMVPIVLKINGWDFAKRTAVGLLTFLACSDTMCSRWRNLTVDICFWRGQHGYRRWSCF